MKKFCVLAVAAIVMTGMAFTSCDSKKSVSLKSDADSAIYIIGASYGQGLKEQFKTLMDGSAGNIDALIAGFLNGANGDSIHLGMDVQEAQMFVNNIFQAMQARADEKGVAEAEQFMAANKSKSGVITTASGLQYQVITQGTGPKPVEGNMIKFHYHGTLLDGTVFDSTVDRGQPAEYQAGGFVPGFNEGVELMPVGSKYKFWIPIALGYNQPGHQLYNKLLIFEVELLEILN